MVEDLQQYLERDMTVMLLTTCSFMLQPILKEAPEDRDALPQSLPQAERGMEPAAAPQGTDIDGGPDPVLPQDEHQRGVDRGRREPLDGDCPGSRGR